MSKSDKILLVIFRKEVEIITLQLETIRKQKGITQAELASMLNVHQSTISMVENGDRNPSAALLCKLADTLSVTLDELIGKEVATA